MPLWRRSRALLQSRCLEDDLDAELAFHLAEKERPLIEAEGITASEARERARKGFGNVARWREETRSLWRWGLLDGIAADLRYAARLLCKQPGFTLSAAVTLAFGIGANAAVFSLFNALLLRPVAVQRPAELALVCLTNLPRSFRQWEAGTEITTHERRWVSYPMYEALTKRHDLFDGLYVIAGQGPFTVELNGASTQVNG